MRPSWRDIESELIEALRKQGLAIVEKGLGERAIFGLVNISVLARALDDKVIVSGKIISMKVAPQ
jgi:hypothetical protein